MRSIFSIFKRPQQAWRRLCRWLWPMPRERTRQPLAEAERRLAMRCLADIDRMAAEPNGPDPKH